MNFYNIKPFGATPTKEQINHMNIEKKAFFHFGVNTFTNMEWGDGKEKSEFFNPTNTDVESWIIGIKKAGFKLAILTAKHHDGFCLWPSKYTKQSIKYSPYKNGKGDIVKEFTDACHKHGMLVGIYMSPWDRNAPTWGTLEYSDYYKAQLLEIVTGYGKIDEIWWDGAGSTETVYKWDEWREVITKYQPTAQVFGSLGATDYVNLRWVGNESGYAGETHYASIDPDSLVLETREYLNSGKICGARYIPAEVDVSIRPGWFYHADQTNRVKSVKELDDIWFNSVGRNAMMLLNFPPNREGRIDEIDINNAVKSNESISNMLKNNLIKGAKVSAPVPCNDELMIENVLSEDTSKFYATEQNEITVDISLPEKTKFNTFALAEVFELGERIVEFSLTDKDTGNVIAKSTSVGRLKFVRFEEGEYKNLLLKIKALAPITLRSIALYDYKEPTASEQKILESSNLLDNTGSKIELTDGGLGVRLLLGGIFEYNRVEFKSLPGTEYEVYAFDGTSYCKIKSGKTDAEYTKVDFETVKGSYQLKLVLNNSSIDTSSIKVFKV